MAKRIELGSILLAQFRYVFLKRDGQLVELAVNGFQLFFKTFLFGQILIGGAMNSIYAIEIEPHAKHTVGRGRLLWVEPLRIKNALLIDHLANGALPSLSVLAEPLVKRAVEMCQQVAYLIPLFSQPLALLLQHQLLALHLSFELSFLRVVFGSYLFQPAFHHLLLSRYLLLMTFQLPQLVVDLLDIVGHGMPCAERL